MKHSSILSSDPHSQKKPISFFAPILATSQSTTTLPRTTSTSSAWNSTHAPAASASHKAQWSLSFPALGPAHSISSKTTSSTNASRCPLCLTPKVQTRTINIDDLFLVALLNALPDKHYSYPKDKIFAENTANTIPDFFRTLETMTNFDSYTTTLSFDPTTSTTPAGPTALAGVTPSTSTSNCVMCQKQFPTIISRESQRPFRNCYTCNKKRRDSPDTTTTSKPPDRPPTIPPAARNDLREADPACPCRPPCCLITIHVNNLREFHYDPVQNRGEFFIDSILKHRGDRQRRSRWSSK